MMLFVLRVMLGLGESVMYPASFEILAREALDDERGRADGWMAAGQLSEPAFGTLAGGLIAAAVALVGVLAYGVIVRRIECVAWHGTVGQPAI
jgi:MFS family permease